MLLITAELFEREVPQEHRDHCHNMRGELIDAWYPGEALDTTVFEEMHDITRTSITVLYESKEARDTARRSGMEHGMAAGYDRLEILLPTLTGETT